MKLSLIKKQLNDLGYFESSEKYITILKSPNKRFQLYKTEYVDGAHYLYLEEYNELTKNTRLENRIIEILNCINFPYEKFVLFFKNNPNEKEFTRIDEIELTKENEKFFLKF